MIKWAVLDEYRLRIHNNDIETLWHDRFAKDELKGWFKGLHVTEHVDLIIKCG